MEHFGRGVLEGVDALVAVADPSYDAVMLIGKIKAMADEGSKRLCVVLNKTDGDTEPFMDPPRGPGNPDHGGTSSVPGHYCG